MDSIQLIIFYLSNNAFKYNDSINKILKSSINCLKINKDCSDFFEKNEKFTIENLMNIYYLFEHFCFDDLCSDLDAKYKEKISDDIEIKVANRKSPSVKIVV